MRTSLLAWLCVTAVLLSLGGLSCSSSGTGGGAGEGGTSYGGVGGTNTQSACTQGCDDGHACTVDACVNGKCQSTIGPRPGATACPAGQYCTLENGCVAAPACSTADQCVAAWKDDACKANIKCEAASSVCTFELLDKDVDGHAPQVCGGDDCNDGNSSIQPGAAEKCNGVDDDCDGVVDEDDASTPLCDSLSVCKNGGCTCTKDVCSSACVDLTSDASHCGACANACGAGSSCVNGQCRCDPAVCGEVLWTGTKDAPPDVVVLDSTAVFWGVGSSYYPGLGGLYRANKDGSGIESLVQGANVVPDLALDSDHVYFTVFGTYSNTSVSWADDGYLARVPKLGGPIDRLRNGNVSMPLVVGSSVFFGHSLGLYSMTVTGGSELQIAFNRYSSPNAATDGTSLFWRDFDIPGGSSCTFYSKPIAGGDSQVIRTLTSTSGYANYCALRFVVDEAQLYWLDEVAKQTRAMPKTGGAEATLETYKGSTGGGLAVDNDYVYYSVRSGTCDGSIRKVPKAGGPVIVAVSSQCDPGSLAVDDSHVYWVNVGDYTLRRIAK